ncbi:uncharacterized protein CLAFUR5_04736 [Fulvia fulva]|uniref:Uncharacterized protein n=1 Tax=Passalora fulva TaxID=5499 RepID=A0A9Q8P7V6_PASFU|nr:uncharacterized protein CLAFUR5_04736 [Fulvia fulva]UJO16277.1 hypothetical protein CLAFUR5_04736 [Fulvia fulva]
MGTQILQESDPDGQILEQGGAYSLVALFTKNMRFGRNHQEHNIEAISDQVIKRIASYEEKRRGNEYIFPPLILTGKRSDCNTYNYRPGVPGGLEDSLEHLFHTSPAENLAAHCETYLSVLAFWNMQAFPQKVEWRGIRGETARERRESMGGGPVGADWKNGD